jgi:hypothetical protein
MIRLFTAGAALLAALPALAAAPAAPAAVRNNTAGTGNAADFTSDQRYEFYDADAGTPGVQQGFLARTYNVTPVAPPTGTSNTVLPGLERAVVEFRSGIATQGTGNRTYGVHVTNASTGLPTSEGGAGVHTALTNFNSLNATSSTVNTNGQINVPWQNFLNADGSDRTIQPAPVVFSIARLGNTMTVKIGDASGAGSWDHVWQATRTSFADINALQLRLASGGTSAWRVSDLRYNGELFKGTADQSLATGLFQADNLAGTGAGNREIFLWERLSGDFTLTGNMFLGWTGTRPTNSAANAQFKFLSVPNFVTANAVPEPQVWAMFIIGFGLAGAVQRRRKLVYG